MDLTTITNHCQNFLKQHPNPADASYDIATFKDIYIQIVDCLTQHNHRYYINAEPIISDKDYDILFSYTQKIEEYYPSLTSQDSPTQKLIGQLADGFEKANHPVKMLSLQNSYDAGDLIRFDEAIQKSLKKENLDIEQQYDYIVEPKFDGISIEVIYQDGKLKQAITRGDGYTGDDITNNVKQIANLPSQLLSKLSVEGELRLRGEIMMPISQRKHLNKERTKLGKKVFANTRNAAAGTVKLLDSNEVKERKLICYIYDILKQDYKTQISSHKEMYTTLKDMGLPIFGRSKEYNSIQDVISLCKNQKTQQHFEKQDIEFDGLVIKLDNYLQRERIGETDHHPRRAIAYKFPAVQAATQLENIEFQVGRTGILTPVAHLTSTKLSGVTISRASLHNMDYIQQKDIRLHDRVWVQRSGEVIPYIVGVIADRRDEKQKTEPITPPTHCPSCSTETKHKEVYVYCPNHQHCPAQVKEKIAHFVSKQSMNIDGFGEKFVELLVEQGLMKSLADVYSIIEEENQRTLRSIPGFGHKRVEELTRQITKSKDNQLRRLINGLGLPGIGKKMAKELQKSVPSYNEKKKQTIQDFSHENLLNLFQDSEFLSEIYGIGQTIVDGLRIRAENEHNITVLDQLAQYGVSFNNLGIDKSKGGPLSGVNFSVTGSFDIPRPKIIEQLESYGAIFDNSPNKKTTFILIGDKAGSKKEKAQKLGIKILTKLSDLEKTYKIRIKKEQNDTAQATSQSLF